MTGFSRRAFTGLMIGGSLELAMPAFGAPQGIDESGFVRIGGIDQWIAIQGSNVRNPVLLYLHGGPGEAQSPFLGDFAGRGTAKVSLLLVARTRNRSSVPPR